MANALHCKVQPDTKRQGGRTHGISILGPAVDGRLLVTVEMEACLYYAALGKSGSPIAVVIMFKLPQLARKNSYELTSLPLYCFL